MTGPAEELRTAAAKLRETAKDATPDRWQLLTYQIVATFDDDCQQITEIAMTNGHTPNARWIALAGPLLADPLAAWLDDVRSTYRPLLRAIAEGKQAEPDKGEVAHALTLARLINGGGR